MSRKLATLKLGSRGTQVVYLQQLINSHLKNHVNVTGIFSENTKEGVIQYQKESELDADGIVGPKTWTDLGAVELAKALLEERLLTSADLEEISVATNIPVHLIRVIMAVESAGSGYSSDTGLIKIQFEPHLFKKVTGKVIQNGVEGQDAEWVAFLEAHAINPGTAIASTSWGLMQVLGSNFKAAGFKDVYDMQLKCISSEKDQVMAGMNYINSIPALRESLLEKDWDGVAYYYNGRAYKKYGYHIKLAEWDKRLLEE